jgi:glycosyltransferase involved in cell wall biosynthesis
LKVSGFSFIRNAIKYDYPIVESITSILPICDEFVIAVGNSDDGTLKLIQSIKSPKIRVIETIWDETLREGGHILAQQTNLALEQITGDWAFYIQGDEVVHENDLTAIKTSMEMYIQNPQVEGLLFNYVHFYGSYSYIGEGRRWYRREVRVIRPNVGIVSWGDAQGFRKGTEKLKVKSIDASIYHYGWVKPPKKQQDKQKSFNKLWHSDEWVKEKIGDIDDYDYSNCGRLVPFSGSHPAVMQSRVGKQNWTFNYDPSKVKDPFKLRVLDWIERKTGIRIAEYKNYKLV